MTTTNTFATKVAVVGLGLAIAFGVFALAPVAKAQTSAELQAQISSLLATIAQLQAQMGSMGGSTSGGASMVFTRDLTIGSSGSDVTALQNWLISKGQSVPAGATGYFGAQTQAALAAWQAANGISPAAGYFGPVTRAKVNAMAGGTTGGGTTGGGSTGGGSTSGDLEGGAGSIQDADYVSGLNNEDVGEDEEDAEVAGLEIEADESSDIMITAVRLNFSQSTGATEDLEDYATEVSVWLDGEEFAREDAADFEDDDNYDKTLSLDDGAIIRAGETGELTVALSGISNLDSSDATDTWTVEFENVRFEDADGASVTDSDTGDINDGAGRSFQFETFATATDLELMVTLDNESADSMVINVDSTDDTDGVELMTFTLENDGDSDIEIQDLPVLLTVTGATDVDAVAQTLYLEVDGEEFSENITATTTTNVVLFEDIDFTVGAGEEVSVIVKADINDIESGTFDEGDTLKAEMTAGMMDSINAEDESGEDLVAADLTGTALGDEMAFYDVGIMVTFVSSDESNEVDDGASNDSGTFTIKYNVEAFDGTVYVSDTPGATTVSSITGFDNDDHGVAYRLERSGTATDVGESASITFSTSDGASDSGVTNGVQLADGESAEFTLTVVRTNGTGALQSGLYRVLLTGIGWATTDDDTMNAYDFDLEDYKTDPVNIN